MKRGRAIPALLLVSAVAVSGANTPPKVFEVENACKHAYAVTSPMDLFFTFTPTTPALHGIRSASVELPTEILAGQRTKVVALSTCDGKHRNTKFDGVGTVSCTVRPLAWYNLCGFAAGEYSFKVHCTYIDSSGVKGTQEESFKIAVVGSLWAILLGAIVGYCLLVVILQIKSRLARPRKPPQSAALEPTMLYDLLALCIIILVSYFFVALLPEANKFVDARGGVYAGLGCRAMWKLLLKLVRE